MGHIMFRIVVSLVLLVVGATGAAAQPQPASNGPIPKVLLQKASEVQPKPSTPTRVELKEEELYQRTLRASALVVTPNGHGTAWVLDREKRLLITNFHVVADKKGQVHDLPSIVFPAFENDRLVTERDFYMKNLSRLRRTGYVVDADPRRDLAVIRLLSLPDGVTELKLAAASANPGESLHVVGNPGDSPLLWHYSPGRVRQVGRHSFSYGSGQKVDAMTVAATSPINPGDSGGPVVNKYGEVVAVNAAHKEGSQLMSASIDVSEVRAFVAEVRHLDNPRTTEDYLRRAAHYNRRGRFHLVIEDCATAIERDSECVAAYGLRAFAHTSLGNAGQALVDLNKAIALLPTDPMLFELRGDLHATKGRNDQAREDFGRALELAAPNGPQRERVQAKLNRLPKAQPTGGS